MARGARNLNDLADAIAANCMAVRIRRLNRQVTRIYEEELRPLGLTTAQLNMLVAIQKMDGPTAAEVSRALDLEKSTTSRNLAKMIEAGWVGTDKNLSLTAAGGRMMRKALPAWERAQDAVRSELGDKAAGVLKNLGRKL